MLSMVSFDEQKSYNWLYKIHQFSILWFCFLKFWRWPSSLSPLQDSLLNFFQFNLQFYLSYLGLSPIWKRYVFVYGIKKAWGFLFFILMNQFSQHHLLINPSVPYWFVVRCFVIYKICPYIPVYFCALHSISSDYLSILIPIKLSKNFPMTLYYILIFDGQISLLSSS